MGQLGPEQRQGESARHGEQERRFGERGKSERAVPMAELAPEELPADEVKTVAGQVFRDLGAAVQGVVVPTPYGGGAGPKELAPSLGKQEAGQTVGERARADRERKFGAAGRCERPGRALPEAMPEQAERQGE